MKPLRKGTKVKIDISMEIQVNQIGERHCERKKWTCVSHMRQRDKKRQRMWITEGSGRVTRLEEARDREVISETEENFSGAMAAKMETGDFRALARGESAVCGWNNEVAHEEK